MAQAFFSTGEAAHILGVSTETLRRWDRQGHIQTERDAHNRRRVPAGEIERLGGANGSTRLGARNRFRGLVIDVAVSGLMAQVELVVTDPVKVVAVITRDAVEDLGLRSGLPVTAIVKSTSMMIEPPTNEALG
jgi:molybdopterin-binding protein